MVLGLLLQAVLWALTIAAPIAAPSSETLAIQQMLRRHVPQIADKFNLQLVPAINSSAIVDNSTDAFQFSQDPHTLEVTVQATSISALSYGSYKFLRDYGHATISWTRDGLKTIKSMPIIPKDTAAISGSTSSKFRYMFNTCTFDYTAAFWQWEDWEYELDWMAFNGINFPLVWNGYERVYMDVLTNHGFNESEILEFFSGPAYLTWNRFGNAQGTWNGTQTLDFIDSQMELSQQMVERMVELGMTPILPAFTGFVPRQIYDIYPEGDAMNSPTWSSFPVEFTNDTFLQPTDPLFPEIQAEFVAKLQEYYGNVTHYYTLDQYNENDPASGNTTGLASISKSTIDSLTAADPEAVWVMQGWLFFSSATFWTDQRIEAYLSGPERGQMLILDLTSDLSPQWQRTSSYYGHDWIWCELHGYGGNNGLGVTGGVNVLTHNSTEAKQNTSATMVGYGLTMEGQEGNQFVYDILLDQAWNIQAINSTEYMNQWVTNRYGPSDVPSALIEAWHDMQDVIYVNDINSHASGVVKAIYVMRPNVYGLVNITGHHTTTIYWDKTDLYDIWKKFLNICYENPKLLDNDNFANDIIDITRQIVSDQFETNYLDFLSWYNSTNSTADEVTVKGTHLLLRPLELIDPLLSTLPQFSLTPWIQQARALASDDTEADWYELNARLQITLWGPTPDTAVNDYANKQWGGLVGDYYYQRWKLWIDYLAANLDTKDAYNNTHFSQTVEDFQLSWPHKKLGEVQYSPDTKDLVSELSYFVLHWDYTP